MPKSKCVDKINPNAAKMLLFCREMRMFDQNDRVTAQKLVLVWMRFLRRVAISVMKQAVIAITPVFNTLL